MGVTHLPPVQIEGVRSEARNDIRGLERKVEMSRTEVLNKIERVRVEAREDRKALEAKMDAKFDRMNAKFDRLEKKIDGLVAASGPSRALKAGSSSEQSDS